MELSEPATPLSIAFDYLTPQRHCQDNGLASECRAKGASQDARHCLQTSPPPNITDCHLDTSKNPGGSGRVLIHRGSWERRRCINQDFSICRIAYQKHGVRFCMNLIRRGRPPTRASDMRPIRTQPSRRRLGPGPALETGLTPRPPASAPWRPA